MDLEGLNEIERIGEDQAHSLPNGQIPLPRIGGITTSFRVGRFFFSAMAVETYISRSSDDVHTDVLAGARQACYKARDAFYACMEKESSKKPTEIASVGLIYPVECKSSRAEFVKSCRTSWVKHFDRLHCQNSRVQRLLDDQDSRKGPLSLPQPYTFKRSD